MDVDTRLELNAWVQEAGPAIRRFVDFANVAANVLDEAEVERFNGAMANAPSINWPRVVSHLPDAAGLDQGSRRYIQHWLAEEAADGGQGSYYYITDVAARQGKFRIPRTVIGQQVGQVQDMGWWQQWSFQRILFHLLEATTWVLNNPVHDAHDHDDGVVPMEVDEATGGGKRRRSKTRRSKKSKSRKRATQTRRRMRRAGRGRSNRRARKT